MSQKVFTPSVQQAAFLDWIATGTGSCVLEAVAGAGKTTTLIEGVRRMKGSVFLGAYNAKMGKELKERVADLPNKTDVRAGTFHSAGYGALRRANPKLGDPVDTKVRDIARSIMGREARDPVEGEISSICTLVSLAKQTGFHCRGLVERTEWRYWLELIARHDVMDKLPEDYDPRTLAGYAHTALMMSNEQRDVIDFDDMVYLPLFLNLRMFQNDWVLVDEAQDTNAVRRALASKMLKPKGRLVAVGDPHQAIYGFTGADNQSLDLIRAMFEATTLRLSVSWRCPRSVVAAAREYVGHIEAAPTAPEGAVRTSSYSDMLKTISPGEAVLCRYNSPLVDLCFRLIREGKPAKIEGRAIGEGLAALVGRWKVKTLDALEGRLEKWLDRETEKLRAAGKEEDPKMDRLQDQHATMVVLIDRARETGVTTVDGLKSMILTMFADVGASPSLVVLSSVHRSKGLEWPVVHILGRKELMPSPRAKQEWQKEQEINLCYVAVTRAQETLVDVAMPTEAELKRPTPPADKKAEAA